MQADQPTDFLCKILNELVAVLMNHLDLVLYDRPVRGPTTKQRLKIPCCASTEFQNCFAARTVTDYCVEFITRLRHLVGFGTILQMPAVCCIIHTHFIAAMLSFYFTEFHFAQF